MVSPFFAGALKGLEKGFAQRELKARQDVKDALALRKIVAAEKAAKYDTLIKKAKISKIVREGKEREKKKELFTKYLKDQKKKTSEKMRGVQGKIMQRVELENLPGFEGTDEMRKKGFMQDVKPLADKYNRLATDLATSDVRNKLSFAVDPDEFIKKKILTDDSLAIPDWLKHVPLPLRPIIMKNRISSGRDLKELPTPEEISAARNQLRTEKEAVFKKKEQEKDRLIRARTKSKGEGKEQAFKSLRIQLTQSELNKLKKNPVLAEHVKGLPGGIDAYIKSQVDPQMARWRVAPAQVIKGENWKHQQINKPMYQIEAMRRVYPLNNLTWRKYGKTPKEAAENYNNFIVNIVTGAAEQKITSNGEIFLTNKGRPGQVYDVKRSKWVGIGNKEFLSFNPPEAYKKTGGEGTQIGPNEYYTTGSGTTLEKKWTQGLLNAFGNPSSKKFMSGLENDSKKIGTYKQLIGPDTTLSGSAGVFTHGPKAWWETFKANFPGFQAAYPERISQRAQEVRKNFLSFRNSFKRMMFNRTRRGAGDKSIIQDMDEWMGNKAGSLNSSVGDLKTSLISMVKFLDEDTRKINRLLNQGVYGEQRNKLRIQKNENLSMLNRIGNPYRIQVYTDQVARSVYNMFRSGGDINKLPPEAQKRILSMMGKEKKETLGNYMKVPNTAYWTSQGPQGYKYYKKEGNRYIEIKRPKDLPEGW